MKKAAIRDSEARKLESQYIDPVKIPDRPKLNKDWSKETTQVLMDAANWYADFISSHSGKLMASDAIWSAICMKEELILAVRRRTMKPLLDEAQRVVGISPEIGVRMTNSQLREAIANSTMKE